MSPFIAEMSSRHSPGRGKLFCHLLLLFYNRAPVNRGAAASLRLFTLDFFFLMCTQNVTKTFQSMQSSAMEGPRCVGLFLICTVLMTLQQPSPIQMFIQGFKVKE